MLICFEVNRRFSSMNTVAIFWVYLFLWIRRTVNAKTCFAIRRVCMQVDCWCYYLNSRGINICYSIIHFSIIICLSSRSSLWIAMKVGCGVPMGPERWSVQQAVTVEFLQNCIFHSVSMEKVIVKVIFWKILSKSHILDAIFMIGLVYYGRRSLESLLSCNFGRWLVRFFGFIEGWLWLFFSKFSIFLEKL